MKPPEVDDLDADLFDLLPEVAALIDQVTEERRGKGN